MTADVPSAFDVDADEAEARWQRALSLQPGRRPADRLTAWLARLDAEKPTND